MEKMRQKIDLEGGYFDLQKLCRPPRSGVICEDLGRTQYKIGSGHGATRIVKKPHVVPDDLAFNSSDDEIDSFSFKNQSSSRATPPVRRALKKDLLPKGMAAVASDSNPKPPPTFKAAKVAHAEENKQSSALRPKARPTFQGAKTRTLCGDHDEMPPSNQLAFNSKRSRKLSARQDDHSTFPLEELSPNRAKRSKCSKEHKLDPVPFPMSDECRDAAFKKSPPHPAPFPMAVPSPKHSSRKSKPVPFPMRSPPTSRAKAVATRAPRPFPLDSPRASPDKPDSDDIEDELTITDKDNGIILTHGGTRPFPMSMSQFLPRLPPVASGFKRFAQDEEDQKTNKKSRPSSLPPDNFSSLSLDGGGNVDPSTICPYCDEPWPSAPSPTLTSLLEHTKRKSYSDPRPGNALGLKAPLIVFVELCQRHRFEMTHLPLALARGWPTRLDFASLPKRIGAFRKELGRFVNRPDESLFWREIRDEVKEVGRMKVVSMSGQYATFERTQPGYYGEQGSIIIHQSLYSLCPPDSIPPASVLPLTADQFLTRVLVPETAVLLIQEDMGLPTKEEAHRVLNESKKYGLAMFPEQAQTKEVADVGEDLARERARAQRKLLEKRGETDADVKREVQKEQRQARKLNNTEKERADVKEKEQGNESDIESELDRESGEEWTKGRWNAKEHSQVPVAKKLTPKARHHRWDENGDVLMLSESQESISRRTKVASKARESSSRQSSHSLSTPLALHVVYKPTTRLSPVHGSNRKLLLSHSSDRQDVDIDEMIVEDLGYVAETLSSDSDAIEESTSKRKPKPRRIMKRGIQNEDADFTNDPAVERTARKPTGKVNHNVDGEGDNKMKGVLGQTKRRKKGKQTSKGAMSSGEVTL